MVVEKEKKGCGEEMAIEEVNALFWMVFGDVPYVYTENVPKHREQNISAADFFSLEISTLGIRSRIYQQLRGPRTLIGFAK
ncbi:hypothetical protein Tco_1157558 [Tanacetum coccineum]